MSDKAIRTAPSRRQIAFAMAVDSTIVIAFIAIGRRNHDEDVSLPGFVRSVAPFVIALAVSWLIARAWRNPSSRTAGAVIWIGTVSVGMALRRFVFDDGTATAFVIVASVFLGVFINGWRTYARFRADS
jgi:FtsH-binding integral membrane protein